MLERYCVCGGYGNVRVFDREEQEYIGPTHVTEREAHDWLDEQAPAPAGFDHFMRSQHQ